MVLWVCGGSHEWFQGVGGGLMSGGGGGGVLSSGSVGDGGVS